MPSVGAGGRIDPRSILIVMLSAVGDSVLVLPVLNALRRAYPEAHLTWALQPGPHALVAPHPAVDDFVIVRRSRQRSRLPSLFGASRGLASAVWTLRTLARNRHGGRFDLLLDLQVYLKAGILTGLTPAAVKLGFDRQRARDLNWVFTNQRISPLPGGQGHIQDQYLEFLHHLDVDPDPVRYGLSLSPAETVQKKRFFQSLGKPAVAIVPASSHRRKNWTVQGYAQVISSLRRDFGLQPLLVGGHSDLEEEMAQAIKTHTGANVLDVRGGGLRRLLWLLDGSRLVITPDSAPLHMARAVETPVIGLFGFTNPKRSGPYRKYTDLVVDGYARFPEESYPLTRERRSDGMARVTPDRVLEKVQMALGA